MDPLTMMAVAKAGGAVFGAVQAARGKAKMKEADKMAPGLSDLTARNVALEEAKRKTRQLESGTDTTTQEALKSANQSTLATQKQLSGVTGGNVGGTVSAMLQAQKMGGNIKNQAFAKAGERGLVQSNLANTIGKEINQKVLDLKQFKSVQRRAEGADALKTGMGNLQAGLFSSIKTDKDGNAIPGSGGVLSTLLEAYNANKKAGEPAQSVLGGGGTTSIVAPSVLPKDDPGTPFFGSTGKMKPFDPSGLTTFKK